MRTSMKDSRRCNCGHYRKDHDTEDIRWHQFFAYGSFGKRFVGRLGKCSLCKCFGYLYKEGALEARDKPGLRTPELST